MHKEDRVENVYFCNLCEKNISADSFSTRQKKMFDLGELKSICCLRHSSMYNKDGVEPIKTKFIRPVFTPVDDSDDDSDDESSSSSSSSDELGATTVPSNKKSRESVEEGPFLMGYERYLGIEFMKQFDEGLFKGKVMSYSRSSGWYHIEYEDGDREDMTKAELEECLRSAHNSDKPDVEGADEGEEEWVEDEGGGEIETPGSKRTRLA